MITAQSLRQLCEENGPAKDELSIILNSIERHAKGGYCFDSFPLQTDGYLFTKENIKELESRGFRIEYCQLNMYSSSQKQDCISSSEKSNAAINFFIVVKW